MDHPTMAAAAASSVAAVVVAAGLPPDLVWLSALAGGLLALWMGPAGDVSWRWLLTMAGQLCLSVALGVGGAVGLPPVLSGYAMAAPLAAMPTPVIALLCSLFAPGIYRAASRWLDTRWQGLPPQVGSSK